jgi:large conductance mechanosensitive channel
MINGFKDFLMRGNVIDLAVGIAIGVAFTTLVGAFGAYFINPIVALVGGGNSNGFAWQILDDNPKTVIDFGALINALIVFAVTMAVIYFAIVVPVQKMQSLRKGGTEEAPEAPPEEVALLREIRDALQRRPL